MLVYTLTAEELTTASYKLADIVLQDGFEADLVIGVKRGGAIVAKHLFTKLSVKKEMQYTEVSFSRLTTESKKSWRVSKVLTKLPYFLLNILRNIEVYLLELFKPKHYFSDREHLIVLDATLRDILSKSKKILIVDDAVDSGKTLLAIKSVLLRENEALEIRSAVLTSTHKKSYLTVEYKLYENVLLRCPWAEDYKNE